MLFCGSVTLNLKYRAMKEPELVRVESEDELRPGVALFLRPAQNGRNVNLILLKEGASEALHATVDGNTEKCSSKKIWDSTHTPHSSCKYTCFCHALKEGRLWRLRTEEPKETSQRKQRETVNSAP